MFKKFLIAICSLGIISSTVAIPVAAARLSDNARYSRGEGVEVNAVKFNIDWIYRVGENAELSTTFYPETFCLAVDYWETSDPEIAYVTGNTIYFKSVGRVTVTAVFSDGTYTRQRISVIE